MTQKVIIFDFDGTIADTLDALVTIANRLAREFGYMQISAKELKLLRNLTARQIIKYSGVSLFKIPFLVKRVKGELKNKIKDLQPIPEIPEALRELSNQGYKLGIITSNAQENVHEFLKCHQLDNLFEFVHSGVTIFGKNTIMSSVIKQRQIKPQTVIYVGDETRDIEAAKKANVQVIAVTWGFNSPEALARENPDFLIDHPRELLEAINHSFAEPSPN
ncbi:MULTISPECIES: HAD-IA family hydrolase [Cylindrospermopsis]|jgi:phosphoglycolate phosphatase|uniref:HAD-IA family hydrolase n=1 Tax=Cylindrospermopsis curvispora GIHE-G1 TaxID=2666332 RepID=A0A7H0EZW6_9CYAN|nr:MULTISPECIES: HAD-IA family hydrolase [Cylindrospermopsis]MBU6344079.1 HAD-IA family hydrolase [Cyanobacteria bacterium REEB494]KRH98219.1 carotenoid oxygenase [Cylindrospermopsis sp. CR12]QNP29332.1 HAD-IA family hydrolase [Cylindrospermopsis curvispora GIHE-G1]TPX27929.1 HAD-IA family hydrolase [Cylindrospermopsis raciborskii GIHE 2018]UJS04290.1 HAD-IA family hydrolase [Cylindrospermopsis raciborskii KLL07]